jgi:probable Rubsico expression protein CbbX
MADKTFTMDRKQPGESRAATRVPEEPEPVAEIDKLMAAAAESEANVQTILRETHVKQVLDDLDDDLVALEPVKRRINEIAALLVIDRLRQAHGLSSERPTLHMSFTGNPGTGKTTVALRMAEILKRLGYLEKGHVVSVTRDELVGQYVGHTAPKTKEVIKRAYGGVLFIDEAYYLHRPENERDYGAEAIEILLQVMEADRDKLVVILAGYGDRMDQFFESNPGMGSRVAHHVVFPDYDAGELMEIADLMLDRASYRLSPDAEQALGDYVELRIEQPRFANGRSIRNAIDRARLRQASRLFESDEELSKEQLVTIEADDIYSSSVFDEHRSADDDDEAAAAGATPIRAAKG